MPLGYTRRSVRWQFSAIREPYMRVTSVQIVIAAAVLAGCSQPTATTPPAKLPAGYHAFQAPPRFTETGGTQPASLELKTAAQPGCQPDGEVSRNGNIVTVSLKVMLAKFGMNNPANPGGADDQVILRSYGGCKAGPVIEVRPGNTLRVNLNNTLAAQPDPSCNIAGPGCFNTVNLHTHGLHVSPAGNSDNVLLNIAPQTKFPYEYNIPEDHPSGTFWYHAHRHGSTAAQVASGESGVLLIRGNRPYTPPTPVNPHPIADIDTILHDAAGKPMKAQLFLLQQIPYACFVDDPKAPWQQIYTTAGLYNAKSPGTNPPGGISPANAPWICPPSTPAAPVTAGAVENFGLQLNSATIWDTNGRFTSVNGVVQPTAIIPAGEIQRWRFIHAGIHDTINLQIVRSAVQTGEQLTGNRQQQRAAVKNLCPTTPGPSGIVAPGLIPQFEIAADGLTRTKIRTYSGPAVSGSIGSNYMQPGYRSDVLVVFPSDGYYCLLNQAAPASERANNGGAGQGPGGQGPSQPQLLAYIKVEGGQPVTGDLETYLRQALYDGNPTLPAPVRDGLKAGDTTPWAPFTELAPPTLGHDQVASFKIVAGPKFQINDLSYDPGRVDFTRQVNTTDDWLLTSTGEPHIFHIHVNPFEVVDVIDQSTNKSIFDANGKCILPPDKEGLVNQYCSMYHTFRDTVFVENGFQVRVRTHYDRYIGEFVIHCHILDHEDGGMMLNINIVPDASAPNGGIGMPGMKHGH